MRCLVKPIIITSHSFSKRATIIGIAKGTGNMPPYHKQFVAIICVLSSWKCTKTVFGHGSAPEPAGRAYAVLRFPDPVIGCRGDPSPFSSPSTPLQCSICRRGLAELNWTEFTETNLQPSEAELINMQKYNNTAQTYIKPNIHTY